MYFKFSCRINSKTNKYGSYYRLVESYRNSSGTVCHKTVLNVGFFEDDLSAEQLNQIFRMLTDMYQRKQTLFSQTDPLVQKWVTKLWSEIIKGKKLDISIYDENSRMVNVDTLTHSNIREIGAERDVL